MDFFEGVPEGHSVVVVYENGSYANLVTPSAFLTSLLGDDANLQMIFRMLVETLRKND